MTMKIKMQKLLSTKKQCIGAYSKQTISEIKLGREMFLTI